MARQQSKKVEGYFDERKVMELLCDLHNKRHMIYSDLALCLIERKRLPDKFMPYDDVVVDEMVALLDAENRLDVIWNADRFKRYNHKSWWRRVLLWLAR